MSGLVLWPSWPRPRQIRTLYISDGDVMNRATKRNARPHRNWNHFNYLLPSPAQRQAKRDLYVEIFMTPLADNNHPTVLTKASPSIYTKSAAKRKQRVVKLVHTDMDRSHDNKS